MARLNAIVLLLSVAIAAFWPVAAQAQADPDAETIGGVYIPAIQLVKAVQAVPLVDRDYDLSELGDGVAWLEGTAWLDDDWARIVLAGHTPGAFENLEVLEPGDEVMIWDARTVEVYVVQLVAVVPVTATSWLMPTTDETLTLITCHGEQRLIIHCTKR